MNTDQLTPSEKLRLKIASSRVGRLPKANKEEKIEKAKAQMAEMLEKAKNLQSQANMQVVSNTK